MGGTWGWCGETESTGLLSSIQVAAILTTRVRMKSAYTFLHHCYFGIRSGTVFCLPLLRICASVLCCSVVSLHFKSSFVWDLTASAVPFIVRQVYVRLRRSRGVIVQWFVLLRGFAQLQKVHWFHNTTLRAEDKTLTAFFMLWWQSNMPRAPFIR